MHLLLNANAMVYYHIHILCIVQWQMHNVAKILIMFSIKFPGPVIFSEIFSLIFFPEVYCLCQPEKLWKKTIKDFLGFPKYDAKLWANEYLQQANSAVKISVACLAHCLYLILNTQETSHFYCHQFWDKNDFENICHWNHFQISWALSELPTNDQA